jgi:hypothetical protein
MKRGRICRISFYEGKTRCDPVSLPVTVFVTVLVPSFAALLLCSPAVL